MFESIIDIVYIALLVRASASRSSNVVIVIKYQQNTCWDSLPRLP